MKNGKPTGVNTAMASQEENQPGSSTETAEHAPVAQDSNLTELSF